MDRLKPRKIFPEWEATAKKFRELGQLGVTSADHKTIGSTPHPELRKNPGKTLGEIFNDQQILEWLEERVEMLKELADIVYREPNNTEMRENLEQDKSQFEATLKYLNGIDRLPKEFENFDVDALLAQK